MTAHGRALDQTTDRGETNGLHPMIDPNRGSGTIAPSVSG
jgi:hypothetical protein